LLQVSQIIKETVINVSFRKWENPVFNTFYLMHGVLVVTKNQLL